MRDSGVYASLRVRRSHRQAQLLGEGRERLPEDSSLFF